MKTTSRINKRNQILLIWAIGLIAAFSSTSFAALGGGDKEAPAPRSNGQQVNGRGGGQDSGGSSCLPNAQAMDLSMDNSGFEDEDVKLQMTDRGPVLKIGDTQIATDPDQSDDPKSKAKGKNFGWCIQNQDFAKNVIKLPDMAKKFACSTPDSDQFTNKDGRYYSKEFKIPTKGGTAVTAQIVQMRDSEGNVTDSNITITSPGKDNNIVLKEHFDKNGNGTPQKVKGKFTISTVPRSKCTNGNPATCADKESGTFQMPLEGTISQNQNDPDASHKFSTCSVEGDNMGPKNKNETAASPRIDLVGSCVIYRGATVPLIGEHYQDCNTGSGDSTTNMSSMKGAPKKGGIGG